MHYEYTAKSTNGDTLTGSLAARSTAEATRQLRERDLFVIAMKPAGRGRSLRARRTGLFRRSRTSKRDLLTLTAQLAIMSRAGVPLASALRLLGTMIESGVPLLDGLRLTRSAIRNSLLKDLFNTLEDDVVNGHGNVAVVGSRTVRVGDDLNGFRVIAIEPQGVTLQRPPTE